MVQTFAAPDCESPERTGECTDPRCLAIKVEGVKMRRYELFDLTDDPAATEDLYRRELDLQRDLHARIRRYRWDPIAESARLELDNKTRQTLEALGYL